MGTRDSYLGGKIARDDADHTLFSSKVKNAIEPYLHPCMTSWHGA